MDLTHVPGCDLISFDMDASVSTPTYYIYREGQSTDPTAPLTFAPAKGSDELFFALKAAFPAYSTHSERMREAVIQFLLNEQSAPVSASPVAQPAASFSAPPWQTSNTCSPNSSWITASSSSSASDGSPVMDTSSTMGQPISRTSTTDAPSFSRHDSQASVVSESPPSMEQMTGVFSLSNHVAPTKTRVRRKMTDAERREYRKRRQVRACESCAKRKRKCQHDVVNTSQAPPVARPAVTKCGAKKAGKQKAAAPEPVLETGLDSTVQSLLDQDFDDLIDFTHTEDLFDQFMRDPVPAPQVSGSPRASSGQFPWAHTQDWVVLDSAVPRQNSTTASTPLFSDIASASPGTFASYGGHDRILDLLMPSQDLPTQLLHGPTTGLAGQIQPTGDLASSSKAAKPSSMSTLGLSGQTLQASSLAPLQGQTSLQTHDTRVSGLGRKTAHGAAQVQASHTVAASSAENGRNSTQAALLQTEGRQAHAELDSPSLGAQADKRVLHSTPQQTEPRALTRTTPTPSSTKTPLPVAEPRLPRPLVPQALPSTTVAPSSPSPLPRQTPEVVTTGKLEPMAQHSTAHAHSPLRKAVSQTNTSMDSNASTVPATSGSRPEKAACIGLAPEVQGLVSQLVCSLQAMALQAVVAVGDQNRAARSMDTFVAGGLTVGCAA